MSTGALRAGAATRYVSAASASPSAPYTTWASAATNIQDAIGVSQSGDLVLVTNGIYAFGRVVTELTNRIALTNPITVVSVSGPAQTVIDGGNVVRCAYIANNAVLSGFTLTNGNSVKDGAGVLCEQGGIVTNCVIVNCTSGDGGGASGGTIYNCKLAFNSGTQFGGGAFSSVLFNCLVVSNSSYSAGGGAYNCTLYSCTIAGNLVTNNAGSGGGGAYNCTLSNCIVAGNRSSSSGGGAAFGYLYSCTVSNNSARLDGGGSRGSRLFNCLITRNYALTGGGASDNIAQLLNCTVVFNTATNSGGGVSSVQTVNNCIVYFNSAATNANWVSGIFVNCCTSPGLATGKFDSDPMFVDAAHGDFRLKCGSPCIDSGQPGPQPVDIRGVSRPVDGNGDGIAGWDIGAFEANESIDESVAPWIPAYSTFSTHYPVFLTAPIGGCPNYFWWDFGDGTTGTNQSPAAHVWNSPGSYDVVVTAFYGGSGSLLSATTQVHVVDQQVYYVRADSSTPSPPYTNWATAATNIDTALAAGATAGRLIWVSNGVYRPSGSIVYGSMYNGLVLSNWAAVQSLNGPNVTTISPVQGRCAFVGGNSFLTGFTLTNGHTKAIGDTTREQSGGAVWCEPDGVVSNCVMSGSSAYWYGGGAFQGAFYGCTFTNNAIINTSGDAYGGGACNAQLFNCIVVSNRISTTSGVQAKGGGVFGSRLFGCAISNNVATALGGGAAYCLLRNCILNGNNGGSGGGGHSNTMWNCLVANNSSVTGGGGASGGVFYNCTITGNSAIGSGGVVGGVGSGAFNTIIYSNIPNNFSSGNISTGYNCCSTPLLGLKSTTAPPLFVNPSAGDWRLHFGSPCIDAGTSLNVTITNDLAGKSRPLDGNGDGIARPDIGAYEFDLVETVGTNWLVSHGFDPNDPLVFTLDPDGDHFTTLQEWIADTDPTNSGSFLQIISVSAGPPVAVSFNSSAGRVYTLYTNANPTGTWSPVAGQVNVPGNGGFMSLQTASPSAPRFYRVGVSVP